MENTFNSSLSYSFAAFLCRKLFQFFSLIRYQNLCFFEHQIRFVIFISVHVHPCISYRVLQILEKLETFISYVLKQIMLILIQFCSRIYKNCRRVYFLLYFFTRLILYFLLNYLINKWTIKIVFKWCQRCKNKINLKEFYLHH